MPPKTKQALGYQRVPITDVVMDDANMPTGPLTRYDWVGLGDAAVALAKRDPNKWQLVDEAGATSTASNITEGRIVALTSKRFVGWKFRGKVSQVREIDGKRRATIWIKAAVDEPVL
jgi:hypothetical protein